MGNPVPETMNAIRRYAVLAHAGNVGTTTIARPTSTAPVAKYV